MTIKKQLYLLYRMIRPIFDPFQIIKSITGYGKYILDIRNYSKMQGAEHIKIIDLYPCLGENVATSSFDPHYFYLDIWAAKRIMENKPSFHVDVGSKVDFVGFLTCFTKVTSIDIRPLETDLDNFESKKGSILSMPFDDGTVDSLSCLHVAEHIGLGRYGDPLNTHGTEQAAKELSRVLAVGGNLFFAVPVGKTRLCFNAHRIHSPNQIIQYFSNLELVEFSGVDDEGKYRRNIPISELENCNYACGFFWFKKLQDFSGRTSKVSNR
jgi:SAM-dependent methyltransferase